MSTIVSGRWKWTEVFLTLAQRHEQMSSPDRTLSQTKVTVPPETNSVNKRPVGVLTGVEVRGYFQSPG